MKRKKLILEDKNKLHTIPWYWCNYRDVHHGTVNRSLFKLGNLISSSILKPWPNKKSPIVGGHLYNLWLRVTFKHTIRSPGKTCFLHLLISVQSNFWAVNPLLRSSSWWFPTHLKNISQNGNLPQIGMSIKNIWNHHPVIHSWPSKQAKHERTESPIISRAS